MNQQSIYYKNIQRLIKNTGVKKENTLIFDIDTFNDNLNENLHKICQFLGVSQDIVGENAMNKIQQRIYNVCKKDKNIKENVSGHGTKIRLTKEQKSKLFQIFKHENQKLFDFVGRDFGWNGL